jgi:hypothetical protein
MEGLLQRSILSQTENAKFSTLLISTNQALFKHVGIHNAALPALNPDLARFLLGEIGWLRDVTWPTTAARTSNWREPPKGHALIDALCAPGAKGHAIRSGLCARSPIAEAEFEKAFQRLLTTLVDANEKSGEIDTAATKWRCEVRAILHGETEKVAYAGLPGSPLRRYEGKLETNDAVRKTMRKVDTQQTKPRTNV